jgi:hypothetical protein
MILLPKIPMRKREFDARVGIFLTNMIFFEGGVSKSETKVFAVRWRLEPNLLKMLKTRKGRID